MSRTDPPSGRGPFAVSRRLPKSKGCAAALAVCLLLPFAAGARTWELRYRLEPGQTWHAVQTVQRETHAAGLQHTERSSAQFRYDVAAGAVPGQVRLDARMLSQTVGGADSPFDFSVIRFLAQIDARGVPRGVHFELGDAEPPEIAGVERDPVAFRQMLRSVASAWLGAVYWLPELPERGLAVGESFQIRDRGDVGGTDPGVAMRIESTATYTLRKVTGNRAEVDIEVSSTVDAATATTGIVSTEVAEGEAVFDLDLGMWTRHETRARHRASVEGVAGSEPITARTVTVIEMEKVGS